MKRKTLEELEAIAANEDDCTANYRLSETEWLRVVRHSMGYSYFRDVGRAKVAIERGIAKLLLNKANR